MCCATRCRWTHSIRAAFISELLADKSTPHATQAIVGKLLSVTYPLCYQSRLKRSREEAPKPKSQAPAKLQARNPKAVAPHQVSRWCLEFGVSLGFGVWNLGSFVVMI